jgi:hypothetical protein
MLIVKRTLSAPKAAERQTVQDVKPYYLQNAQERAPVEQGDVAAKTHV